MPEKQAKSGSAPSDGASFPELQTSCLFSLIELIYEIQMSYIHDWYAQEDVTKKKDVQIVKQVVLAANPLLKIDVEQNDPIHLILLNVIWAMLQDPENTIIQITWVRAQYILAV